MLNFTEKLNVSLKKGNDMEIISSEFKATTLRPMQRMQEVTTLLGPIMWELLALVAWCMKTNAKTAANIVNWGLNNCSFCPKLFLYLFIQ